MLRKGGACTVPSATFDCVTRLQIRNRKIGKNEERHNAYILIDRKDQSVLDDAFESEGVKVIGSSD